MTVEPGWKAGIVRRGLFRSNKDNYVKISLVSFKITICNPQNPSEDFHPRIVFYSDVLAPLD